MNIKFPAKIALVLEFSSTVKKINDENRKIAFEALRKGRTEGPINTVTILKPAERIAFILPGCQSARIIIPSDRPLKRSIRKLGHGSSPAILIVEYTGKDTGKLNNCLSELLYRLETARSNPEIFDGSNYVITYRINSPTHRSVKTYGQRQPEAVKRTLTANMTGSITLTGTPVNLHFNKGALKYISGPEGDLINNMNGRTRFLTSEGDINYRNESAFAFDDNTEYGLRTLQVPQQRKKRDYRIITDFIFGEGCTEALISITVDYPEFEKDTTITEAAVFETPLFSIGESGISISVEGRGPFMNNPFIIRPNDNICMMLPGKSFTIKSGLCKFRLTFHKTLKNHVISSVNGLAVKTGHYKGRKVLYINPGGSYTPSPSAHYSGIREQFCFSIFAE